MNTPMLDFVLEQLERHKGRWPEVAEGSGVPYRTMQKIAERTTKNPGIGHVQALYDYFVRQKAAA